MIDNATKLRVVAIVDKAGEATAAYIADKMPGLSVAVVSDILLEMCKLGVLTASEEDNLVGAQMRDLDAWLEKRKQTVKYRL